MVNCDIPTKLRYIWQVFPSHNIFLLPRVFFLILDLCVRVLEVHISSWAPGYFYLRFGVTQIFNEKKISDILGGVTTPQTSNTPQNWQNSSTLGHDHTVKSNFRIILLDTIEEPMARGFQNTPYFNQSNNLSTFGGCPKFVKFLKNL